MCGATISTTTAAAISARAVFGPLQFRKTSICSTVFHYIERNPVRASLVASAERWLCSSAAGGRASELILDPGLVPRPASWLKYVNEPQTESEA
jgi:hypothetical protein